MVLIVLLLASAFIALICICERRLHVEKFRELNEKKANKARAKAEKQAVTAPLLMVAGNKTVQRRIRSRWPPSGIR